MESKVEMKEKAVETKEKAVQTTGNLINVKEDKSLLDIKYDRKFSEAQLEYWSQELAKAYPKLPKGLLRYVIDMYSTSPHIFEDLMEDHKLHPEKYVKKIEPIRFANGNTVEEQLLEPMEDEM
tara:strand:+ start:250 stop:618 length:369 start_codon:yes stop_codon:yes gene_type:complete